MFARLRLPVQPGAERQARTLVAASSNRRGEISSCVRATTTTTRSVPSLRTLILLEPGASTATLAGETESATRGRATPAPVAESGAGVKTSPAKTASASADLTGRAR